MILELKMPDGSIVKKTVLAAEAPPAAKVMERFWLQPTMEVDNGWTIVTRHVIAFRVVD